MAKGMVKGGGRECSCSFFAALFLEFIAKSHLFIGNRIEEVRKGREENVGGQRTRVGQFGLIWERERGKGKVERGWADELPDRELAICE